MRLTEVTWELVAELWWVGVEDPGVLIPLVCPYLSCSEAAWNEDFISQTKVPILVLPLACCVTSSRSLYFSELQFPPPQSAMV